MKEARIDEVLDNIAGTSLVNLPDEPVAPSELLKMNLAHREAIGKCFFVSFKFYTCKI